jgi:NAD(P)-dependent dehydrogenase (short-subunit alcohol dehydrogenase family)
MTNMLPRVALVTGGNRGLGLETVRQLSDAGFHVLLGSRDLDSGRTAQKALGARVRALHLDVTSADAVALVETSVEREHGRLDVLINNAAAFYDTDNQVLDADFTVVRDALDINTIGAWRMAQMAARFMLRQRSGRIVNVSSSAGSWGSLDGHTPAYSLSKLALNGLTRMLAARLRGSGVLVNAVCPGWVATDMGGRGGRPVTEGARGIVWAAMLPDDGPTGGFFRDGQPIEW